MTNRKPGTDWSDDRLDAAFAARAAVTPPAPQGLADDVLAHLPPRDSSSQRWRWVSVIAAATAVAVVVGLGGLLSPKLPQPGPSLPVAAASDSTSSSNGPATSVPISVVLAALGDPMTVVEALAVRRSGERDREILVSGHLAHADAICAMAVLHPNPTVRSCADYWRWLGDDEPETSPPSGPAIYPSFVLVGPPPPIGSDRSVRVTLIGHFNDRRASFCDATNVCEETFVVDRVVEVDGNPMPVRTTNHTGRQLKDIDEVLDALVAGAAPGAGVLSRQVVDIKSSFSIEPLLANDPVLSAWDPTGPLWLVTAVDLRPSGPIARTFALIDGSDWFAEVTANGVTNYLDRTAAPPSGEPQVPLPTGDPAAFDSAPTSILGIPVRDIASLQRARAGAMDHLGRDEHAVRAWYLGPAPGSACSVALPPVHPPTPPCDEARHWLLDDPRQYGAEEGQVRVNPAADHHPPVLNPLLPIEVSFDVGDTWVGDSPEPRPVIVLGHFADHRVDTYAGNLYFVIDALAWTPDHTVASFDTLVRLTDSATEDVGSVLARIGEVATKPAVVTWTTVMDSSDFSAADRRSTDMPELRVGAPVWMVSRLVRGEMDGRERLAVEWAWTADGGQRVWWTECPDCSPDLATSLDVQLDGDVVKVYDYDRVVTSVGRATGMSGLDWQQPHGNSTESLDVARGRTAQEVVIRWFAPSCSGVTWNVDVHDYNRDGGFYFSVFTRNESCEGDDRVVRRIVVTFDHPIDINKIDGPSCCG